jgi:hypothetical protein
MATYLDDSARSRIVSKIMDDVPKPNEETIKQQIQDALYLLMKPEIADFHKQYGEKHPDMFKTDYYEYTFNLGRFFWGNLKCVSPTLDGFKPLEDYSELQQKQSEMREKLQAMFKTCRTVKSLHEKYPEFAKYYPADDTVPTIRNKSGKTAEELAALAEAKRKQEEEEAKRRLNAFSVAANLSALGWTPSETNEKGETA